MKLWTGRFSKEIDARTNDFNSSISFDSRMFEQDIKGSMAHAEMLFTQGIIDELSHNSIQQGLSAILQDIKSGSLSIDETAEDIHTFIEGELTNRIGEAGKRLHTGRSRNDQVALDFRLYLVEEIREVQELCKEFITVLAEKAELYHDTVMPGYTHLQRAQPITFGHHLLAYAEMLLRDIDRLSDCNKRTNISPLGSGALAGTSYPLDRMAVANSLHMNGFSMNSLDGVSDRDFCIEYLSALSIIMVHLSRLCEEVILWCSWEFKFIQLDDAFSTGSSIMPQKKNPDIAELARGKSGRVFGSLMTMLTVMKGLPLAYNKDMQEDKECVFDASDTVKICLLTLTPMFDTMKALPDNMRSAAAKGFINATDCADYLTQKGMPFRDAYKITGELVAQCIAQNETLEELPLAEYKKQSSLFDEDIYQAIDLDTCVSRRNIAGGPAPEMVLEECSRVKAILKNL